MAYERSLPNDPLEDKSAVLDAALAYIAAGRSVAPISPNQKYPQGNAWKVFQTRLATPDEIRSWFQGSPLLGICLICGKVSGGLENLDFDDFQTYNAYDTLVTELGYTDLLRRLVIEQSPRPGIHLGYCCEVIQSNTKLARQKIGTRLNGKDEIKTLIETRGEGGLIVVTPTPPGIHPDCPERGYELIQGEWTHPPLITPEEREILWNCARALNRYTPENRSQSYRAPSSNEDRVGNDYNAKVSVDDLLTLLESEDWQKTYSQGDGHYLRRPGKTRGYWSATLNICGPKRLYVFTTNGDPFDNDRSYDPFGIYMRLKHGGDAKAAAKALAELGYGRNGQPPRSKHNTAEDGHHQAPHEDDHFKPIPPYLIKWSLENGNALYYQKPGTTDEQQLANFMAWITEERQEDDGAEVKRVVQLEATLASGKTFSEITTSIPDFYSLAGILKALGTEAIVSPGPLVKDRIRHAIQLYSNRKKYPQRQVFTHLGWRKIDGVWRYLHTGGSIPAGVEVSPEKALESYRLPTTITPGEAIQASLRVLECAPRRITVPLLSLVYLAPLAEWLNPDVMGWLEGPSGARKSSLAALMLCHFGTFDRVHPPDSWESSANELERLAFLAKDTLLWVDDYAPRPSAKEMHAQEVKAQRLIRAQGNLSGRGRMRADMSLRPAYYPRGVTLSTGELHPTGTSTFARMLQLDLEPDDVNLQALTASQAEAPLLAHAMVAYLQWLQPQLERLTPALKSQRLEVRAEALSHFTQHTRQPEVFSHLVVAWELFLGFACDVGVLSEEERQARRTEGLSALTEAVNRQRFDAEAEDPTHRFCSQLVEAFAQGKAYLDDTQGWYPPDAAQWGWTLHAITLPNGGTSEEWKPTAGASMLGWIDQDFLYLLPDASYRLAFENLNRAGMTLLPQQALWKLLVQKGYVQRSKDRLTTVKQVSGHLKRVLVVNRKKLGIPPVSNTGKTGKTGNNDS